jgi:hypothetical protein
MYKFHFLNILIFLLLVISCSEEEFAPQALSDQVTSNPSKTFDYAECSNATLNKPKVDVLFVWDNTGSSLFISPATQIALQKTITLLSDQFDFHILVAPLFEPNPSNPHLFLMADNPTGLNSYALSKLKGPEQVAGFFSLISSFTGSGALEAGYTRTTSLVANNISNGIFRQDSYVFTVLMSNGDDNTHWVNGFQDPILAQQVFNTSLNTFMSLKNQLNSLQLRFISLVAHSTNTGICANNSFTIGNRYIAMSSAVYNSHSPSLNDQIGNSTPDSYSICNSSFNNLFAGPNESIQATITAHVYNYWPISNTTNINFDPGTISVVKNTGQILYENDPNGFVYIPSENPYLNQPTRIEPSVGEVKPGLWYMIKLLGNGKVTWPECLSVSVTEPADYFGFIPLAKEPNLSTVNLVIAGKVIPQNSTNGWQYIPGFQAQKNIKVKSPSEPNIEGQPPIYKSGYFLKLHGSAIYSNSTSYSITFTPAIGD